ncbi:unnamed protein product [Rotaria sordida]|uniref:3-hydroxyisobutyryl-CoA hydrolase n=1 Tax=Rotaria sordida TaxID=392033 RepID=A0A815UR33_9BILA|nr:unnamed protein product [Rotaria sordida]
MVLKWTEIVVYQYMDHFEWLLKKNGYCYARNINCKDLFPNGSDSHFLSRLPNNLGVFLSLTGHCLYGLNTVYADLARHFISTN